jgi:predicted tellurium resistance membrane protein TerC
MGMSWVLEPGAWAALAALTALEIVLGIDNVVFLTILVEKLPPAQRRAARTLGLSVAMIARILLLLSITWVMRLTAPLFTVLGREISGRDLIVTAGGLFLLAKATLELHEKLEEHGKHGPRAARRTFWGVIAQILLLDLVFSLDSVLTAVGLAQHVPVMILAIVIAVLVMMASAAAIGVYLERHPTLKVLALAFLLLIGLTLVAEGIHFHIPRGSIYFAMAFSLFVEMVNLRVRARRGAPACPPDRTEAA